MSRKRRVVPGGGLSAHYDPQPLAAQQWAKIEGIASVPISAPVRSAIEQSIAHFNNDESYRRVSVPEVAYRAELQWWQDSLNSILNKWDENYQTDSGSSDAERDARRNISSRIENAMLSFRQERPLSHTFSDLREIRDGLTRSLRSLTADAFSEPVPWNEWITNLTRIFDDIGVPTTVRRDGYDKKGPPSPFVQIVEVLNQALCFPTYFTGPEAFAAKIDRAQKSAPVTN